MRKRNMKEMSAEQFRDWLLLIVKHDLFVDRERLLALLGRDADRDTLTEAFRECFEGYYFDVAYELDAYETSLLSILEASNIYATLNHRVAIVKSQRRASPLGREVRRMGSFLPTDSVPTIKVSELSDGAFREFLCALVKSEFFEAHARVVKLLGTMDAAKSIVYETTGPEKMRLREAVYEFFVCHLELEQFLEDYAYDPDEGLELRPEVAEALEQSISEHKSGKVTGRPLQEVAKTFGVKLRCTHP